MNYQDMMNKAKLYQEATKALNQKPQLIQASESRIYNLEKEIAALEEKAVKTALNDSMNKLNPLKFFAKKEEDFDVKITELETEIKKEKRKIDGLKNSKTAEYINLEAVKNEAVRILAEQNQIIEVHKQKVLDAQAAYYAAIRDYQSELDNQRYFCTKIQALDTTVKAETFIPTYPGAQPSFDNRLNYEVFSPEVIKNHRQRPNLTATLMG
ncbi:hypothetical protein [Trichococcus sp.]|uniref:hypothetical protein n=1 Tax=Trichococcus sp. TaxID=1985464 RepID=UPI003C7AF5F4